MIKRIDEHIEFHESIDSHKSEVAFLKEVNTYIKNLKAQVGALEEMMMECTSHGELDSRLFNAYMEHAIKP